MRAVFADAGYWVATADSLRRLQAGVDEAAGLVPPQRGVMSAQAQQLLVRALLDDAALIEHDQTVHPRNGGQPVRHRNHSLARHQRLQARLDGGLDLAVERGGWLVEHQDRRILEDLTRNGDALALAARELHAALADLRLVAAALLPVLELMDELVGVRELRRPDDLRVARPRPAITDVVADGAVQQGGILRHHANLRAQALLRDGCDVLAVNEDAAAFQVEKAEKQVDEGGLAGA